MSLASEGSWGEPEGPGKALRVSSCCRCVPCWIFSQTPSCLGMGTEPGHLFEPRLPHQWNTIVQSPFLISPDPGA